MSTHEAFDVLANHTRLKPIQLKNKYNCRYKNQDSIGVKFMNNKDISFKEGTALHYPIKDKNGVMLLNAGTRLTHHLVSLLYSRGIRLKLSASLEVVEGGIAGTKVNITEEILKIGRSKKCKIRPNDKSVSGIHCTIKKLPLSLQIQDMNGTKVNGKLLTNVQELEDGDIVGFGSFSAKIQLTAVLQGDGANDKEVAELILADVNGCDDDPDEGITMKASAAEVHNIRKIMLEQGLI